MSTDLHAPTGWLNCYEHSTILTEVVSRFLKAHDSADAPGSVFVGCPNYGSVGREFASGVQVLVSESEESPNKVEIGFYLNGGDLFGSITTTDPAIAAQIIRTGNSPTFPHPDGHFNAHPNGSTYHITTRHALIDGTWQETAVLETQYETSREVYRVLDYLTTNERHLVLRCTQVAPEDANGIGWERAIQAADDAPTHLKNRP